MDVGARVWVQDPAHDHVWVSARIVRILRPAATQAQEHVRANTTSSITHNDICGVSVCFDAPLEKDAAVTTTSAWSDPLADPAPSPSKCRDVALVRKASGECENVLLQNQCEEQDQSDLVALPHLHEASILHALRVRYERDAIYTRIGEILISINPFKKLPQLYGRAVMETHAVGDDALLREPHLFGIARAAYVDMVRNARCQSILISGESGAGKTEATKIMMKYYALTCSASASAVATPPSSIPTATVTATTTMATRDVSIEAQVLQSNPILEAFGNARTTRNDNSSRFGKFIELQFATTAATARSSSSSSDSDSGARVIAGARIRTYLLEKIRVIKQAAHERNFHIFYELLAAVAALETTAPNPAVTPTASSRYLSPAAVASWQLLDVTKFRLVNQSACYTRRDGVGDAAQFDKTCRAMRVVGMRDDEVADVLEIVAAMLHMGNVGFTEAQSVETDNMLEAHVVATDPVTGVAHFAVAAQLLRVAPQQLADALTTRQLRTATESLVVRLDAAQASSTCNALVMECYRLLFEWLVGRINAKIRGAAPSDEGGDAAPDARDFIGLLDIFGFEDMAANSFEQLCINYANEALQHQFNECVFAAEQQLYATEGIGWTFVDFPSNRACLELFERKPIGIFSLADQECLFPTGSDRALAAKLYAEFETKRAHPHFLSPAGSLRQTHFVIAHYAGRVAYAVDGFLAKNKDAFCESAAQLLAHSTSPLIQSLAAVRHAASADTSSSTVNSTVSATRAVVRRVKSSIAAVSVGTQFKQQLGELLDIIRATTPHYVRCVKPNDANARDAFECARVVEQLRSGGVLEAVRVARAGFPVRMTHVQFLERYERVLLLQRDGSSPGHRSVATRLSVSLRTLAALLHDADASTARRAVPDGVSLGKTRVFFRRQPYEQLERHRAVALRKSVIVLQTFCRMHQQHRRYERVRRLALRLQAQVRGQRARALVRWMRETINATLLQAHVRGLIAQRRFERLRRAVVSCQSHVRRRRAARVVQSLREVRAATRIATAWRCLYAARAYSRLQSAVLALQCATRVRAAKRQFAARRLESKNIVKLQEDNLQLKGELAQLKQQLEAMRSILKPQQLGGDSISVGGDGGSRNFAALEPQDGDVDESSNQSGSERLSTISAVHDSGNPNCADGFVALRPRRVSFPLCVDLVTSAQKPTLASPNSQCAPAPLPRGKTQRRTSLPDMPYASSADAPVGSDGFPSLSPRTLGRRHSLDLWRAQQQLAEQEVQQLRDELKASARASPQLDDAAQQRAVRKLVASQIRAKTMRLQLSPSSSASPTFALQLSVPEDNNSSSVDAVSDAAESPWYDDDDDDDDVYGDDDDERFGTARTGRRRSLTVEDASFTMGGRQLYAAPSTACGAYSRFSWGVKPLSSKQHSRGLAAYFDGSESGDECDVLRPPVRSASLGGFGVRPRSSSGASTWRSTISITPGAAALPRWSKDSVCSECHCKFSLLTRRHHCRGCGHSFCFEHSTRKLLLPHLGYTERQRVCDGCFELHLLNEEHALVLARSPRRHHTSVDSESAPIAPLPAFEVLEY